jgi:hypothetical protein
MELQDRIESQIVRAVLGHAPEPPVDLFQLARRLGVEGIRGTEFRDGYTDFRARHSPVIFLNRRESGARMRFIFAHEIAHVILRTQQARYILETSEQTRLLRNEEELADLIGAVILVPDSWLYALRNVRYTLSGLERVARLADVPLITLISRMSSARINVALLRWQRGDRSWHIVDRPGAPSCLQGYFEPSDSSHRELEELGSKEWTVTIDGRVDGRHIAITGPARRRGWEAFQLIEPSCEIWTSAEDRRPNSDQTAFCQVPPTGDISPDAAW